MKKLLFLGLLLSGMQLGAQKRKRDLNDEGVSDKRHQQEPERVRILRQQLGLLLNAYDQAKAQEQRAIHLYENHRQEVEEIQDLEGQIDEAEFNVRFAHADAQRNYYAQLLFHFDQQIRQLQERIQITTDELELLQARLGL